MESRSAALTLHHLSCCERWLAAFSLHSTPSGEPGSDGDGSPARPVDVAGPRRGSAPTKPPDDREDDDDRDAAARRAWDEAAAAIVRRIAHGDRESLAVLYRRYSRYLFALIVRVLRDHAEAEDTLQEAFVKVWRLAHRFDSSRGSVTSWLATLARHLAIDRARAGLGARPRPDDGADAASEALPAREDDRPLPEAITALDEDREAVRKILAELPGEQRRPIELAYFDGLTQTQIAEALREPLGTVKTRMRAGFAKLRDKLRARFGGRP